MKADEVLRRYLVAGDVRDYDEIRRLVAADVITHSPGGARTDDADALIQSWVAAHEGLSGLDHAVADVLVDGSMAAARVRVSGTPAGTFLGLAPTGARVDVELGLFVRVESGRIVEMWEIADTGLALRQLGVVGEQSLAPGVD
jgi:predicted ester cyclase